MIFRCPHCKLVYTNNHDISSCYNRERGKRIAKDHEIETNPDGTWVMCIDTVTKLMGCIDGMCHVEDWK